MTLLQTSVAAGASGPLIVLSGVADISTITQLSGVITSQLSEITRQLMIDVSGLRFANSAAIALLLVVARTLKGQGGTMVLIWPQPAVARAVTLADPRQIIMIQGSTPRTPESEGGGSPELGPRCRDLPTADYAAADQAELEKIIEPTRYFRAKGKTLISPGQALCDRFGGDAPDTLVELVTLPHVGRKTANVILGDAFGKPSIVVDTRFTRPARRFGWTAQTDPDMIECDVAALLPPREWTAASHRVIWHGRRVCHARRPACGACGVARRCPSFGAGPTDEATARTLVKTGPFS